MRRTYVVAGTLLALGAAALALRPPGATTRWSLALTDNPTAVAVDGRTGRAFVTVDGAVAGSAGRVLTLDLATGALVRAVTVGYHPDAVVVATHGGRVYVANDASLDPQGSPTGPGSVSVLDARTGRLLRTLPLGTSAEALAVRERTRQLVIVSRGPLVAGAYGPGMLSLYDVPTGRLRWQARLGTYPTAIALDEPTAHVFVSNILSDDVSIVDARTGRSVRTIRLGARPGTLAALCLDARTRRVVTLSLPPYPGGGPGPGPVVGQVSLLDPRSGRLLRIVRLSVPYGLSCDPRMGQIVVGGAQGARVLDGRTGRLLRTLPTGPFQAMAVDAQTARAVLIVGRGVAPAPDPWAWVLGWLRRRLPLLPAPPTSVHLMPGRVSLVDLSSP